MLDPWYPLFSARSERSLEPWQQSPSCDHATRTRWPRTIGHPPWKPTAERCHAGLFRCCVARSQRSDPLLLAVLGSTLEHPWSTSMMKRRPYFWPTAIFHRNAPIFHQLLSCTPSPLTAPHSFLFFANHSAKIPSTSSQWGMV